MSTTITLTNGAAAIVIHDDGSSDVILPRAENGDAHVNNATLIAASLAVVMTDPTFLKAALSGAILAARAADAAAAAVPAGTTVH